MLIFEVVDVDFNYKKCALLDPSQWSVYREEMLENAGTQPHWESANNYQSLLAFTLPLKRLTGILIFSSTHLWNKFNPLQYSYQRILESFFRLHTGQDKMSNDTCD